MPSDLEGWKDKRTSRQTTKISTRKCQGNNSSMVNEPKTKTEWWTRGFSYLPKFITNPLALWLYIRGVVPFRWKRLSGEFITDMFKYKHTSWKQKLWAYKRGFLSERIDRYRLTDDNYADYLSDIEFYNYRSYKNTRLSRWFDDKITTYYILQPYKEHLPIHYCWIMNGRIRQLDNTIGISLDSVDDVINLLESKHELAVKHTRFSHGIGFHKLSFDQNRFKIDLHEVQDSQLRCFFEDLNDTFITEYLNAHSVLKRIYPTTPNPCRLVVICDPEEGAQLVSAQIRIGTGNHKFVENVDKGESAIVAGIRLSDGSIFDPVIEKDNAIKQCIIHPDTGVKIEGMIPQWNMIVGKILEISNYLMHAPYLSYDVVCTEEGFKILEINSHGGQGYMQITYPFFRNKYQSKLFGRAWHDSKNLQ